MKILGLVAVLAGLLAAPAFAQDAPTPSWTGAYIGIEGGLAKGSETYTYDSEHVDFDVNGYVAGVRAGYDSQMGNFVLGIQATLDKSSLTGEIHTAGTAPCFIEGCTGAIDWYGTLGAKAGLALGQLMPYLTAGVAVGGIHGSADLGACAHDPCSFGGIGRGFEFGAGLGIAISDNAFIDLALTHVSLGTPVFSNHPAGGDTGAEPITFNAATISANFRF